MLLTIALLALCALAALVLRMRSRLQHERATGAALRAALDARIWEDRVREFDQLHAVVRELPRLGHEVNNALSAALLSSELFFDASHSEEPSRASLSNLAGAAEEMVEALRRLKTLIQSERFSETTVAPSSAPIAPVDLFAAVRESVERLSARHPGALLVMPDLEATSARLRVSVCGGGEGLKRALDALLENACEGDGTRRARRVEVSSGTEHEVGVVALEIADDGPGFTQTGLDKPIRAFETTKAGKLGLGLYTAERIARASGGSLRRANTDSGGAIVSLFLPVATEPSSPQ